MSFDRIRVASSDWCASRMVVSVISSRFSPSIQSATALGPSRSSICFSPSGAVWLTSGGGAGGCTSAASLVRPATSGFPLTLMSPMNVNSFVARSRLRLKSNSSGVWSMNFVW